MTVYLVHILVTVVVDILACTIFFWFEQILVADTDTQNYFFIEQKDRSFLEKGTLCLVWVWFQTFQPGP